MAPRRHDMLEALNELDARYGVPRGTAIAGYRENGFHPLVAGEVSLATGWRLAASYASRGPECLYFAMCAIGEALGHHGPLWVPAQLKHVLAVVTFTAPRGEVAARVVHGQPTDDMLDPCAHPIGAAFGIADELRLAGPLPAAWVTAVESLAAPCKCDEVREADRCQRCPVPVEIAA